MKIVDSKFLKPALNGLQMEYNRYTVEKQACVAPACQASSSSVLTRAVEGLQSRNKMTGTCLT
jgi:hypothetical protein